MTQMTVIRPDLRAIRRSTAFVTLWALAAVAAVIPTSSVWAAAKAGAKAPALQGQVIGGAATSLQKLRGKVVLVDFWATWCGPCRASLPKYEALQRSYGKQGLVILAVSVDEEAANVARFIKKHHLTLSVIHDKGGKIAERFGPPKMPTAYLIGRDGIVRWVHAGFKKSDGGQIEAQIKAALGTGLSAPPSQQPKAKSVGPRGATTELGQANPPSQRWIQRARGIMGTRFAIMARVRGPAQAAAVDAALDHVAALERLWSPWIATSDLARLNAASVKKPVILAKKTIALLGRALALCRVTGGAFDPTFFSLHGLWRLKARPFSPPSAAAIRARLADVGCDRVTLQPRSRTATRRRSGTRVHLGGDAKGTALDEAAALLVRAGVENFVVDGGGDLVTRGGGPTGVWRVGIKRPRGPRAHGGGRGHRDHTDHRGQVAATLRLSHGEAVATSGDYERYVDYRGKRYHHILDPRTGVPVQGTRQVTVIAPRGPHAGERADGLATAVFVLGPQRGLALIAQRPGVDALVIDGQGRWHLSPGMRTRLGGVPSRRL